MTENTDRGVATVIGFALIFGILIISFSIYQGIVIPEQNNKAEFEHNERAQTDLLNLRQDILETGLNGIAQSGSITVGATYQQRSVGVNFAVTGGIVRTREPVPDSSNEISIRNARAIDEETADYFNGSKRVYPTKSIVYSPIYTRYDQAPDTVIAGGATTVFNEFKNTNISIGDQILVNDRTITVVVINGSLTKSKTGEGATVSVATEPLSVATNRIVIENQTDRINITIPTRIDNVAAWKNSSLQSEIDDGRVYNVTKPSDGYISIILEKGRYTLRMAKVGVGTDTEDTNGVYLTAVEKPRGTVPEESSNFIKLEVRDKFNNPINGFQVNGSIFSSTADSNGTLSIVGASGRVTQIKKNISANTSGGQIVFDYTAPEVDSSEDIELQFSIRKNESEQERVRVNLNVYNFTAALIADETEPVSGSTGNGSSSNAGRGPLASSSALFFEITVNKRATITGFSFDTPSSGNLTGSDFDEIKRNPPEVKITADLQDGVAQSGGPPSSPGFAENTDYTLDTYANLSAGSTADVNIGNFGQAITVYGFTTKSDADIIVTLKFSDGSEKEFYIAADKS